MREENYDDAQEYFTTTVALVTAKHGDRVNVMSAEWTIRSSIDPFLIAVFVGYARETYNLIKESGEFGLSYCSDEQGELAHIAGNYSLKDSDKFAMADFKPFSSRHIDAPLVGGAISNFECKVIDEFKSGDHAIFVGEVLAGYYDSEKKPLVFHQGHFWKRGGRISH